MSLCYNYLSCANLQQFAHTTRFLSKKKAIHSFWTAKKAAEGVGEHVRLPCGGCDARREGREVAHVFVVDDEHGRDEVDVAFLEEREVEAQDRRARLDAVTRLVEGARTSSLAARMASPSPVSFSEKTGSGTAASSMVFPEMGARMRQDGSSLDMAIPPLSSMAPL